MKVLLSLSLLVFLAGVSFRIYGWLTHTVLTTDKGTSPGRPASALKGAVGTIFSGELVAIVKTFFTDVLFGEQMNDPVFAAEIQALPVQVNEEIRTVIYLALDGAAIPYAPVSEPLGPVYQSLQQVAQVVAETPYQSPYVHFAYEKVDRSDFTAAEVATIADAIIATLSLDGIHPTDLDARLNMDDWRSARPHPSPANKKP